MQKTSFKKTRRWIFNTHIRSCWFMLIWRNLLETQVDRRQEIPWHAFTTCIHASWEWCAIWLLVHCGTSCVDFAKTKLCLWKLGVENHNCAALSAENNVNINSESEKRCVQNQETYGRVQGCGMPYTSSPPKNKWNFYRYTEDLSWGWLVLLSHTFSDIRPN